MKRLFSLIVLTVLPALCASWDGTKGSLTISTIGDSTHTVLSLSSITRTPVLFMVSVTYRTPSLSSAALDTTVVKTIYRPVLSLKLAPSTDVVMAIFDMPQSQIQTVIVTEYNLGESQLFEGGK